VRVIDIECGIVAEADVVQLGQRRQGAGHAVDAIDRDDRDPVVLGRGQDALQIGRTPLAERLDADAVGLGNLRTFLHGIVSMLIDDQQIAPADQTGQGSQVRQADGRINQHRFRAQPGRQLFLGQLVGPHRREGSRSAVMGSPASHAAHDGSLHSGILIQPQKAVGAEIDHPFAVDFHLAIGSERIRHQVFQVRVRILLRVLLDKPNQAILT